MPMLPNDGGFNSTRPPGWWRDAHYRAQQLQLQLRYCAQQLELQQQPHLQIAQKESQQQQPHLQTAKKESQQQQSQQQQSQQQQPQQQQPQQNWNASSRFPFAYGIMPAADGPQARDGSERSMTGLASRQSGQQHSNTQQPLSHPHFTQQQELPQYADHSLSWRLPNLP